MDQKEVFRKAWKERTTRNWTAAQAKALKKGGRVAVMVNGKFIEFKFNDYRQERLNKQITELEKKIRKLRLKIV